MENILGLLIPLVIIALLFFVRPLIEAMREGQGQRRRRQPPQRQQRVRRPDTPRRPPQPPIQPPVPSPPRREGPVQWGEPPPVPPWGTERRAGWSEQDLERKPEVLPVEVAGGPVPEWRRRALETEQEIGEGPRPWGVSMRRRLSPVPRTREGMREAFLVMELLRPPMSLRNPDEDRLG